MAQGDNLPRITGTSKVSELIGLMTYNQKVQPPQMKHKCMVGFPLKWGLGVNLETRGKWFVGEKFLHVTIKT